MSGSWWPHGLQPTRLLCPWDSPGKKTRVVSHSVLQGISPTQRLNPGLLHCRRVLYHLSHQWSPNISEEISIWVICKLCVVVAQSCPTLCDPMDCSPPGSAVHGILQARILEWVAISFSRGSSQTRDQAQIACIVGRLFTVWVPRWGMMADSKCLREQSQLIPLINLFPFILGIIEEGKRHWTTALLDEIHHLVIKLVIYVHHV